MKNPVANLQRTAEAFRQMEKGDKKRYILDAVLNNALYILMLIFIVYTAVSNPNFLKARSIANIVTQVAQYLPLALGIGGCIVLTGTDLSAGRVVGLTAAVSVAILQRSDVSLKILSFLPQMHPVMHLLLALAVAIAIGALIGFINGFFVAKFSLHPFIVTLATQLITYGFIVLFFQLNGNNGRPLSGYMDIYSDTITGQIAFGEPLRIFGVTLPWYVLYAAIFTVIMWFIWNKTTFGKNMFAVGSNPEAANVSGVNVFKTTVLVHTLAGVMYGLTGFIDGSRIGSVTTAAGNGSECDAIAACVIGGVSFVGGTGKISGIVLGVFILRIIFVALNMLDIDPSIQNIIKGMIILAACALDMRKYLVKK